MDKIANIQCQHQTIYQLFQAQAAKKPDNTALVFEDQSLTYKELNAKSNQLARVIRLQYFNKTGNQLQPDTLIALCLERSLEMIISILAVLKAGGAYVPIDPEFPKARIQYILEDTNAKIVLTQERFTEKLNEVNSDLTYIAVDHYNFADIATDNLPVYSQANDLAYVIYTSGTTGKPKGVMIKHCSLLLYAFNALVILEKMHQICFCTTYTFDLSVTTFLVPLLFGRTIHIYPCRYINYNEFECFIKENNIEFIKITPSIFYQLLDCSFPLLFKTIVLGGEKIHLEKIRKFKNQNPHILIFDEYGPTETTVGSMINQINVNDVANIGKPYDGYKVYILDKCLNKVPEGVSGELYISGNGVAKGYLNQPELTKKCFINNPFASQEDIAKGYTRLYKTGDLCRYLPDGNIEYIGRNDFQVKIRGFRIELGEIENALSRINGIKQACVIAKSRTTQNIDQQYLAAFYVLDQPVTAAKLHQKTQITPEYLITRLKDKLPAYMIPSSWTELSALPLTTNGKIDRKALPEPKFVVEETYIAPKTDTEKKVCQIWQDILNIPRISITDNFFKIGVDSIIAIRVGALLSKKFNKNIYVGDIFKYQTIKVLSDYIDFQLVVNNKIPIAKGEVWPLSFAQQRLCFIEEYEKGTNAYHVPWLISFAKDINIDALKQSIVYIAERHQTLKTVFQQGESGKYYQVISTYPLKIQQRDYLSKNQLVEQLTIDVNQPFDLFNYLPIRVVLYKKNDTQFTHLLINVHHVAIDGWSLDILANELLQCYEHFAYQKPLLLPTLKIQYKDFACWQRKYLQGEKLKTQLNYWRNKLSNYEILSLATDKPRPANFELVGSDVYFTLDQQLSNKLKNLAKEQGCTLYTLMLTGFYILLHKYTSQQDIIIGTPVANRHYPDIQNLIGFFVNHITLRQQVKIGGNAQHLMGTVQAELLQAQLYQDIPFEKLVTELNIDKDTSRHPIFQIAFSVQNTKGQSSPEISQYFKTESVQTIYPVTKLDLLFIVDDAKDPIELTINYASALFNKTTIERLAVHYQLILTQLVEQFGTLAIQDYRIITDQEYQKIVYQWNQTDQTYPKDKTLNQLFEAQVLKSPNNTALIFKDKSLTYQELNIKSNQLARVIRLQYLNITGNTLQPDNLVALYLERSFDMIISILAVLKAGGAYVPIDPEFPKARIKYILEDTQTKIVLTQKCFKAKLNQVNSRLNSIAVDNYDFTKINTDNLPVYSQANDLAYVIYTSGTTGKPKGVQISHSGVVNVSIAQSVLLKLHSQSTVLQYASITFDASVVEIFTTLLKCATLVICPQHCRYNVSLLVKILQSYHIDIATIPANLLKSMAKSNLYSLKTLVVAGETCPKGIINKWVNHKNVINAYGPTENTVCATMHQYQPGDVNNNIGKPIDNIKCYILNHYLQPVPIGAKGELYIAGVGLARGYLNQPNLTKERFITNPFATKEDIKNGYTRLYKTGDLCRYLPDGNIEYLGRNDFQVKIRGFRIELGEVENALSSIPGVQSSVVIAQSHDNKPSELVAYYICDKCYAKKQGKKVTSYWSNVYNHQYQQVANKFKANFAGWNSYITGKAFPLREMQEWQERTLQRIRQQKIENIFEIGVGSGLLMYPLLAHSEHYAGIDVSKVIINCHQQYFKSGTHKVKLFQGTADQIDQIMPDQQYDSIVINSVSQYFPNIQYFDEVMLKALKKLTPKGTIFIGDVRDYNYHHDLIEAKQTYHNHSIDQAVISDIAFKENELLIAPDYFLWQKNRFSDCSIDLLEKEGNYCNELNQYRYDVIIKKRDPLTPTLNINIVNHLDIAEVAGELKRLSDNVALVIDGVVNPWVNQEKPNIINQYKAMAEQFGLECKLHRKSQLGKGYLSISFSCVDVYTSDIFKDLSGDVTESYNIPCQSAIHQEDIIYAVSKKLPQYMIPSYFMRLEKLPLTVNGKIDRKALPKYIPLTDESYVKPVTSEEKKICELWQSLLGLDKVGINGNFFRIGGNSILAIQAAFQMSALFNYQISVADIFKYQTPSTLADFLMDKSSNVIKPFSVNWYTEKTQNKPMMYFIHPSCAGCEVYQSLAKKLSAYYHCIGIDNYNLYASEQIISLSVLAKYYLSQIMRKSPMQKITLLGWSLGGVIALEMAYWLEQQCYRNINIILLDTYILGKMSQIVTPSVADIAIKKMGVIEKNDEYITKIKLLFRIEQGIQQSQLSGKLQYSVVNLFQAVKCPLTHNVNNEKVKFANIVNIPTDHFGVINYIVKHWHLYAKAFERGNFEAVSDLKPIA